MDWENLYLRLWCGPKRIPPAQVDEMTWPEVALALREPDLGKPLPPSGGATFAGPAEALAFKEWLRAATPAERLEWQADNWGG